MNWQKEVRSWISKLQQEIDGLTAYTSRFSSPQSSPKHLPEKFQKVIHILREGLLNLIDKSNSLLKFASEPSEKLAQLRNEYQKAMKSLQNLYTTFNQKPFKQAYNFSTFNSRVRSLSRKELSPSRAPVPPSRHHSSTPKKQVSFKEPKLDLTGLKAQLKSLRSELDKHEHEEYSQKIKRLESGNEELRRLIEEAGEDAKDNFQALDELRTRLEYLEKSKGIRQDSSRSRKRYLLKTPSQTSDSMLGGFD